MVDPGDKTAAGLGVQARRQGVPAIFAQFAGLSTGHGYRSGHNLQHNLKDLP
jgi:hypothetical protein